MIYKTETGKKGTLHMILVKNDTCRHRYVGRGDMECLAARDPGATWAGVLGGADLALCSAGEGLARGAGSLAGLMDVLVEVMGCRKLLHRRNRFLMGHLSSSGGEVFIPLKRTTDSKNAYCCLRLQKCDTWLIICVLWISDRDHQWLLN